MERYEEMTLDELNRRAAVVVDGDKAREDRAALRLAAEILDGDDDE
jgi:hypothetical protein